MTSVIESIEALNLYQLDHEWVEAVYLSEYQDFDELPDWYASRLNEMNVSDILESIIENVTYSLTNATGEDQIQSWSSIAEHIKYRKLLTILGYFLCNGNNNVTSENLRTTALLAARVYFKLLSIPRSVTQDKEIFHCQLFTYSLQCLGFPKAICDLYDESKCRRQKNLKEIKSPQELRNQVNSVIRALQLFADDLQAIADKLPLNPDDPLFEEVLDKLVEVIGGATLSKLSIDKIELGNLTSVIYEVINVIVSKKKPENNKAVKFLFKILYKKLVGVCTDSRVGNVVVRSSYVTYSGLILSKYGNVALDCFHIMLQHLAYALDGLERAETRNNRVEMLAGLMTFLPGKIHADFVIWVVELSKTSKVLHRQVAVDLLEKMLSYHDSAAAVPIGDSDRRNASAAAVEGQETAAAVEGQETAAAVEGQETAAAVEGKTENAEPQVTEEEWSRILEERTITVSYEQIFRALYIRVADTSSAVRMRAITIFTSCLSDDRPAVKQALQEIQGDGDVTRLQALAARAVVDDRAVVRRVGITLVQRLIDVQETNISDFDIGILVNMCRDANMSVRMAAITALTDLIINHSIAKLFDAFLSGPMRQIKDPEDKVAELMIIKLRTILIDPVMRYTTARENPTPWLFLDAVIRHNMWSNLKVAGALLAKNTNCISVRLVDILSTHLGVCSVARDLQVLVLLSSLAPHVEYSDISFLLDYYYRLYDSSQSLYPDEQSQPSLIMVTLDILTDWSRFATVEQRTTLHTKLVERLAAPIDDGCRIAVAFMAIQLDGSARNWATELMQMAEGLALSGGALNEWIRAADLSLVSTVAPSPALLNMFLTAMARMPAAWTAAEAGQCVAAVGRLCVRSRTAASVAAPVLADVLRRDSSALQARINALLILTDICVRFTNIVEPLINDVSSCLDSNAPTELRRQAVRAITRLLLSGYLRLRPPLIYKYCGLMADDDRHVREPAEYYVTCSLPGDNVQYYFVDCLKSYNTVDNAGKIAFEARLLIYNAMLQRLSLPLKFKVYNKLIIEVFQSLANILEEGDGLGDSMRSMLIDAITVVSGPMLRTSKKPAANDDTNDGSEIPDQVSRNYISKKMFQKEVHELLPALLRLYSVASTEGGQLIACIVRLITDLLNEHRQAIEENIPDIDEALVTRIQQFQEKLGQELITDKPKSSGLPEPGRTPGSRRVARGGRRASRGRLATQDGACTMTPEI